MTDLVQLESQILARSPRPATKPRWKPCASRRWARRARSGAAVDARQDVAGRTQDARAAINLAKDTVTQALTARRDILKSMRRWMRGWRPRPSTSRCRCARRPAEAGQHPSAQPGDGRTDRDLRRHGFCRRRRPGHRDRRLQFHQAEFPRGPSGPPDARHVLLQSEGRRLAHVLRTHTSPVQVRTMLTQKPPIRIICPGRTYRIDSDATHSPQFHQVEGLVIDKGTHLGHLKWMLRRVLQGVLRDRHIEHAGPAVVLPVHRAVAGRSTSQCRRARARSASAKARTGWRLRGCGMVHPNVLRELRHRSRRYQGFALGMGIDRMAMLKYGMSRHAAACSKPTCAG